ncbi:unnamed protein product [Staurois parvus]|uniref:Uncharacterized protein n=1 Tax=Staurois parvus TaxID=386267 RepID=A0ABN9F7B9_9NEOB|nr:unnamed protein product [Staurois parvus]
MENHDHGALLLTQTSGGNTAMFHAAVSAEVLMPLYLLPLILLHHHRDCSVCLGMVSHIEEISLSQHQERLVRLGAPRNPTPIPEPQRTTPARDWKRITAEIQMMTKAHGVILQILVYDGSIVT